MAIQANIRIYGITEMSQAAWRASDVLLEQRWFGRSTRCSFFDVSDIHISVWHHTRFTIAVWYLVDDCLAISAIAGKRHLQSPRTGLLPVYHGPLYGPLYTSTWTDNWARMRPAAVPHVPHEAERCQPVHGWFCEADMLALAAASNASQSLRQRRRGG